MNLTTRRVSALTAFRKILSLESFSISNLTASDPGGNIWTRRDEHWRKTPELNLNNIMPMRYCQNKKDAFLFRHLLLPDKAFRIPSWPQLQNSFWPAQWETEEWVTEGREKKWWISLLSAPWLHSRALYLSRRVNRKTSHPYKGSHASTLTRRASFHHICIMKCLWSMHSLSYISSTLVW